MIWIIGCKGMLGTELSIMLEKHGVNFIGTDREIDITDISALNNYAADKQVRCIVNCAAYTAVDKAEEDTETCAKLNTLGAENIAVCAKNKPARLIHISTDYVFDGKGTVPYREDDKTSPTGVYGLSKLNGEIAIAKNNPHSFIIRTAWLYGKYGNNFVSTMIRLMNERKEIKVVDDQRGSPTWAYDLAFTIMNFINTDKPSGIYHYTNEGCITWFDFAAEIYKQGRQTGLIKNDCSILPCSSDEYPSKVKRPAFSVLDKNKIKTTLGIEIPEWNKSLKDYLELCAN